MYIVSNKEGLVLSKTKEWIKITDIQNVRVFDTWLTASQLKMKMQGEEVLSCAHLLAMLIVRLEPLGDSLHTFLMRSASLKSISEVGGEIERANHSEFIREENEELKKEVDYYRSKLDQFEALKILVETQASEIQRILGK